MKKEPLSIITIKTLLAVIIFTGVGTIIVGGGWLIGNYERISEPTKENIVITNDKTKDEVIIKEEIKNETADWKTYQDKEYGFEMKYPEDWDLKENRDLEGRDESLFEKEIAFISPFEWEVEIPTDNEYEKETLLFEVSCTIYKEYNDPCEKYNYPECGEVALLDNTFRSWEGATPINSYVKIIIPREDFFIVISSVADISPWDKKEFNQILSTFKFIEKEGGFTVEGLSRSEGLYRANSTNSPLNITYKCDGPLRNLENIKYEYCETNGKDYLTQYEFSDLTSSGFGTGGGTVWRWYKLYIKRVNGVDVVFQGHLYDGGNWVDDDNWIDGPLFYSQEDKEKYKRLSTKKYLDGILTNESVIDKINKWDEFVESL